MEDKALLYQRLAELPPDKRALLRKLLEKKAHSLQPRKPDERVPLTFSQQRLWVLDQFMEGNAAYNESNFIRLKHAVDVDALRQSINEIIRRHESLRTTFNVIGEEPVQNVGPPFALEIPLVDLRQVASEAREQEALRLAAEQARIPFNLKTGPLLRASIYRLDAQDFLFALTMHHIICDGWSMGVLAVELSSLYWSFVMRKPLLLPELSIQYPDFAVWQRRAIDDHTLAPQLEYWRRQLANLPTLELPTDRQRPARFDFSGARQPINITGTLYKSLTALSERSGVTLHILLLTALNVLLHRYTGQDDIAIGSPVAGRNRKELEPIIGFFINTLVIRADLSGDPQFLDLLARVQKTSFAAFANQDVPFERLVEELHPVRDQSRNPLVQVAFQMFQRPSAAGLNLEHIFRFLPVGSGTTKFDLAFHLMWAEDKVWGYVEYSVALFDESRMERMVGHLLRLLESIVAEPEQPISRLRMLTDDEQRRLLVEWNATATRYPRDSNIPAAFVECVQSGPESPAVRFGEDTLSYAEVDDHANSLAARLHAVGVRRGDKVGLLLERSLRLPSALLGILKCGAVCVPVDPLYPAERLSYLLSDSGARTVVSAPGLERNLNGFDGELILIDESAPDAGHGFEAEVSADDAACIFYTSGTTGRPKGVVVSHRNILRLVKEVRYVDLSPGDAVLHISPLTFDASSFELWGSLLNGAQVVIYPPVTPSLDELGAFIRETKVTLMFITTSLFRQMIDRNAADLRGVRQLITGGEVLPVDSAKAAWKALPRTRIFNAYGPTECATYATMYPFASPETMGDNLPIGKPIENTTVYILDKYGNPVPVGVPGEIYLGGDGVVHGYLNRPDLTAKSFVPDSFNSFPGRRLYRTGDMGRFREDGHILFLGRRDRQIKLSGYRIELAEVEAAIASHEDISGVAVALATEGDPRMIAYIELLPGKQLTFPELRKYLSELLPQYMIPTQMEIMARLPLTPTGKVDYAALAPSSNASFTAQVKQQVAPRNALEKVLAMMWVEILRKESVGVTDNFFDLGGQSLVATRLLSRLRETFNAEITMRQFFDNPTVAGLSALLLQDERMMERAELILSLNTLAQDRVGMPADAAAQQ